MQVWPSKTTQSTDGATNGEVLNDRGDPFFGVPKKGSLPMEPPMERVGDRAIVSPRGVQKVRPSDFDATRPSDFDATLGRWSLPPCLPRQSTLPSQLGCYQASPSKALRSEVGPAECAERLNPPRGFAPPGVLD